ncbi:MAG: antibiotic biosynthesis monooxygenase [Rhodobacteraceae bacterium]|nr:antibiotic biosynthesis monooxygenase [Paracoccaceae bacterium]
MLTIDSSMDIQTVITTYEVTPGTFADLLEELQDAFQGFIRYQPGFLAGAIHGNDAQTRIANYTQWENRDLFLAVLRTDKMRRYHKKFSQLSKSFEPVLYDAVGTFVKA